MYSKCLNFVKEQLTQQKYIIFLSNGNVFPMEKAIAMSSLLLYFLFLTALICVI